MTNQERAEKIAVEFGIRQDHPDWAETVDYFASQLDEAVREAGSEIGKRLRGQCYTKAAEQDLRNARADGFGAARKKAAEIAEFHSGPSIQCAEKIRATEDR